MRTFKITLPMAIGVALLTASSFAMANGADPYVRHREVSYADLNLSRVEDATKLYQRIERTARDVCRTSTGMSVRARPFERSCADKAIEAAVQSVSNSNLTAVHQSRTSKRAMVASSR